MAKDAGQQGLFAAKTSEVRRFPRRLDMARALVVAVDRLLGNERFEPIERFTGRLEQPPRAQAGCALRTAEEYSSVRPLRRGPRAGRSEEGGMLKGSQDRASGVLVGLAAGDRIGGPVRMALRVAGSLLLRAMGFARLMAYPRRRWAPCCGASSTVCMPTRARGSATTRPVNSSTIAMRPARTM